MHPGDTLGHRYTLTEHLGSGNTGEVWRADDGVLHRTVAVKVLHHSLSQQERFRERIRQDAFTAAAIDHPSVAALHDYNEDRHTDDTLIAYVVTDFVDGQPLSNLLRRNQALDIDTTLPIIADIAAALHEAHLAGLIHSDISPANILVRADGSAVLTDLGIARARRIATGETAGTVDYRPPEQARGADPAPASDIYALGAVAYHCLAGHKAFGGDTAAIIDGHLYQRPNRLPEHVPLAVNALVMRAMSKKPEDRFPTAAAMARDCRQINYAGHVLAPLLSPSSERGPAARPAADSDVTAPIPPPPTAADTAMPLPSRQPNDPDATAPRPATMISPHAARLPDTSGGITPVMRTAPRAAVPSRAMSAPDRPVEPPSHAQRHNPRKRLVALLSLATASLVILALLAAHVWIPDDGTTDGVNAAQRTAENDAELAEPDSSSPSPSASTSKSKSASPSESTESASQTPDDGGETTSSHSPTPSKTPSPDPTTSNPKVTVPDVIGMDLEPAKQQITGKGLQVSVERNGEGEKECGVESQDPAGGSKVKPDSTVTITVTMVPQDQRCDGGESEQP